VIRFVAPTAAVIICAAAASPAQAQWAAKVCSSQAASVTFPGPDKDHNNVFATWTPQDGQKVFPFPDNIQSLGKLYFKATTPGRVQTDMCVLHNGTVAKKMSFNGGNEDHDISAGDTDSCAC
jgi:hypothetical protein